MCERRAFDYSKAVTSLEPITVADSTISISNTKTSMKSVLSSAHPPLECLIKERIGPRQISLFPFFHEIVLKVLRSSLPFSFGEDLLALI